MQQNAIERNRTVIKLKKTLDTKGRKGNGVGKDGAVTGWSQNKNAISNKIVT